MYCYVIFDFDGTLADTKEGIVNAARYALDKCGIQADDQTLLRFIGPSLWDSFKNLYGFDAQAQTRAVAYYREYYFAKGMYESALYPGIRALLETLKEKKRRVGLASAKLKHNVEDMLRWHGIAHLFDIVAGSSADGSYCDKGVMIADVLNFFGVRDLSRAVYIGDSITDCTGAKTAGIDFIAALYDRTPEEFRPFDIVMPAYEVKDIYAHLKL